MKTSRIYRSLSGSTYGIYTFKTTKNGIIKDFPKNIFWLCAFIPVLQQLHKGCAESPRHNVLSGLSCDVTPR